MKKIYVNLKRFDISKEFHGVNTIAEGKSWGKYIVDNTKEQLKIYKGQAEFSVFFPEAHLFSAMDANDKTFKIGCQSVHEYDTEENGNFGAFTTFRTANAMKSLGVEAVIIGHCEERNYYKQILGGNDSVEGKNVDYILNQKIKRAVDSGLQVLFCIGENSDEVEQWQEILKKQIEKGLENIQSENIVIAYEPVWAIGPGKTPPDRAYIEKIAKYIKTLMPNTPLVYGGGLKKENAKMLASIPEIDGGLIALTRFKDEIGFYPDEFLEIVGEYLE